MNSFKIVAGILPKLVRDALVRASQIQPSVPPGESVERTVALDEVTRHARAQYPQYFSNGRVPRVGRPPAASYMEDQGSPAPAPLN